jgi:hypothetical protein
MREERRQNLFRVDQAKRIHLSEGGRGGVNGVEVVDKNR